SKIRAQGRATQGVKIINLKEDDKLVSLEKVRAQNGNGDQDAAADIDTTDILDTIDTETPVEETEVEETDVDVEIEEDNE
ncbi:MAG: gyrase C-terminal domain, beta-propeller, partial [Acidobacteriota bacterium]|nr:gyrase C-terminal domain, beta-propeller [Acidobacteriota bacterium]